VNRPVQYRAIEYFEAVRRFGSIREAARRLDVSASAINRQILKFEQDGGVLLFERLVEGMRLTPAGEIFARHAIAVLQDEKRLQSELDALQGLRRGEVSIIAAESLNARFLPRLIGRMAEKYPGVALRVSTAGSNDIPAGLVAGDADLGLAFSLAPQPALSQVVVGRFKLGAVMRPDHKLARLPEVSFAACLAYPVILPSPELSIHTLLERPLRRFRGKVDMRAEVSSMELMRNLTVELNAISFQASIGLEAEISAGRLKHVPLAGGGALMTELGAYIRLGRAIPVALEVFITKLRDEMALRESEEGRT
jgi:DNA-binding transcriptional LysR family regulator